MPNLVGTGLNQVPTNSMLGGLAYQDPEHASIKDLDLKNLSQINSEIADTAVDVFVYDTRKDSDGGAWRKRTQHTSWYNETLNTATRGSRREFPAVAVIVATSSKVTIYDGDDPDLPMWMVFDGNSSDMFTNGGTNYAVTSLNGILSLGENGAIWNAHFISDRGDLRNSTRRYDYKGNIEQRNDGLGYNDRPTSGRLVHSKVNDVAMTVLPNAPIDPSTGLPIPTIAVGTDGGLSVIRDDGKVFDIVYTGNTKTVSVAFNSLGNLNFLQHDNDVQFVNVPVPVKDSSNSTAAYLVDEIGGSAYHTGTSISGNTQSAILGDVVNDTLPNATSGPSGLTLISNETPTGYLQGAVAYATTSYNTGWMHGDIKGAFLSDTDTTNLTGSELVTNGSFGSDVSGWQTSDSTNTYSSGKMQITRTGGSGATSYQAFTTVVGTRYVATAEVNSTGSRGDLYIKDGTGWSGTTLGVDSGTNGQLKTLSITFTATSTTTSVAFSIDSNNTSIIVDNVSVRVGEEDRSLNNTGLAVLGTINKNPVASGADLVAYSNFQADNRLIYSASNMAFGTENFSVSVWCIPSTDQSNEFILELNDASDSNRFYLLVTNTSTKRLYLPWDTDVSGSELTPGEWNHIVVGRMDGYGFVYVNGKWISDGYKPYSTNLESYGRGTIGNYSAGPTNDYAWSGSLALLRISGSVPSAEQVKKMYEDEKHLFQENAKCTLYGSSDAVTALAYDDSTNLLHVGTSAGRSEFQGLRRINNTTTAVTTAISASNGLIAEQ